MSDTGYIKSYEIDHIDLPLSVIFVRHGQPESQDDESEFGPGLSSLGKRQAQRVAKRLSAMKLRHIYTSDLARARQTAQPVMEMHPDADFTVSADLREVANYHFLPETSDWKPKKKETAEHERDALTRFANRLRHTHDAGQKIAVVAHGNLIRTLMPMLAGRDPRESILIDLFHSSVSILEVWKSGEAILKLANCVKHLLPRQVT